MTYAQNAQYDGDRHTGIVENPGFSSYPNGVLSFSGVLKEEFSCTIVDREPISCMKNTGNDNTNDIGAFAGQPPVILVHGTEDTVTPYANGKAIYEQAQSV